MTMKKTQVLARIARLERLLNQERPDEDSSDEESGRSTRRKQFRGGGLDSDINVDASERSNGRECVASKFLAIALTILLSGFIYFCLVREHLLRGLRQ
ncbi:hypothetical protein Gpo141_00002262 [Globisporangium polare]